ncbi:MAG: hypothetical protein FJ090_21260 [Deltaproteobacteria bacterium]|nr:hypothetical protein [Deltaproteobacteria bacterium]
MPRTLVPCSACASLVYEGTCACPHCGHRHPCAARKPTMAAVLLGIGLASGGCPDGGQSDYSAGITDWAEEEGEEEPASTETPETKSSLPQ